MMRLASVVVVFLVTACATVGREGAPVRIVRGRSPAHVTAAVLDALAAVGAYGAAVRTDVDEGGTVVRVPVTVAGFESSRFLLEVHVRTVAEGVAVDVAAEPAEASSPPLGEVPAVAAEDARSRAGCGCPAAPTMGLEARPRDDLLLLSQGRRLVRRVLAALDDRLR